MTRIFSTLLICFTLVSALSGCAQDVQPGVEIQAVEKVQYDLASFCSTKSHSISQDVTISDVTALANHRDGRLVIMQKVSDSEVNNRLLKLAKSQDVYPACMEYLSASGLMRVTPEGQLLARVYFDFDSEKLTSESRDILAKVAEKLASHPDIIRLEGNTDSKGSVRYNDALGLRRAVTTQDYLGKQGVNAVQLKSESLGEAKPLASNDTAEGRRVNRRVDLLVSPQEEN
ncbi:OmpA family protein [Shewanella psychropiezotolerans]|uniref:OmpA family protein n=1 Tax=Shewanella psychropiezotolerans TaxID=2593655 RepID=A0ABX5X963_9GAMM|nr:OmpA family protein [Shewanella psychropiezotolerans]QDO85806.1 OmpA family protein [Shewanella psychropiezotolerans]